MGSTEKFCLRWNDFEANISGAFRELREDKDFFDITLACDDDQVEAHKVILSACSPFFRTVLKRNKHQHPLVYLKGVRYTDLLSVLNFMYHGEVNVAQEELNSFLAVAEDLKVKGLTQNGSSSSPSKPSNHQQARKPAPIPVKKSCQQPPPVQAKQAPMYQTSAYQSDDEIQEVVPVIKSEPLPLPTQQPPPPTIQTFHPPPATHHSTISVPQADTHALAATEDYTDYEGYDTSMNISGYDDSMQLATGDDANKELDDLITQSIIRYEDPIRGPIWQCSVCKKENKDKAQIKRHVETHITGFTHSCYICAKEFKSRESLRIHSYTHKQR